MERTEILKQLNALKTVDDLAVLLNAIKQDEFGKVRYGISASMLKHFSSDKIAPKRFRLFHIRKKSGGLREIKACEKCNLYIDGQLSGYLVFAKGEKGVAQWKKCQLFITNYMEGQRQRLATRSRN